jgi:hypothetical protein
MRSDPDVDISNAPELLSQNSLDRFLQEVVSRDESRQFPALATAFQPTFGLPQYEEGQDPAEVFAGLDRLAASISPDQMFPAAAVEGFVMNEHDLSGPGELGGVPGLPVQDSASSLTSQGSLDLDLMLSSIPDVDPSAADAATDAFLNPQQGLPDQDLVLDDTDGGVMLP